MLVLYGCLNVSWQIINDGFVLNDNLSLKKKIQGPPGVSVIGEKGEPGEPGIPGSNYRTIFGEPSYIPQQRTGKSHYYFYA